MGGTCVPQVTSEESLLCRLLSLRLPNIDLMTVGHCKLEHPGTLPLVN